MPAVHKHSSHHQVSELFKQDDAILSFICQLLFIFETLKVCAS